MGSMRRTRFLFLCIFMFINTKSFCQDRETLFVSPLDIPLYLSGNFAELRSTHFHSGLDFKTQGVTGKKVYSVAEGYVSRIKVQSNGYGFSVYVNHPSGHTSVYAHLLNYSEKIGEYVKAYQYRNRRFELDIYPGKDELPVARGEVIGLSGNSGSSGGPHLHFELRKSSNQHPVNPLSYNFEVTDRIPPRVYNLYLYAIQGQGRDRLTGPARRIPLIKKGNVYVPAGGLIPEAGGQIGLGGEVYDFTDGSPNRCGVWSIKTFLDQDLRYHFQTDEFSFAESRYIHAHTDPSLKEKENKRVHLLFLKPNNSLSLYRVKENDGLMEVLPGDTSQIRIEIRDFHGNGTNIELRIAGKQVEPSQPLGNLFRWYEVNSFQNENLSLRIPAGSLYENTEFSYSVKALPNPLHPFVHSLHREEVPLHKSAELSLRVENLPAGKEGKLCIVKLSDKNEVGYMGGEYDGRGFVRAAIREFGDFTLGIDSIAPLIIPLDTRNTADLRNKEEIRFQIRDDLSGIEEYSGTLDGKWVLFEFDAKNDLLRYAFDPERIEKGKDHTLILKVTDRKGNVSQYEKIIQW